MLTAEAALYHVVFKPPPDHTRAYSTDRKAGHGWYYFAESRTYTLKAAEARIREKERAFGHRGWRYALRRAG